MASKLMHLVWRDMEEAITECEDDAAVLMRKEREEEDEALLRGGKGDVASNLQFEVEGIHPANITVVRSWPLSEGDSKQKVVTGAGDGYLRLIELDPSVPRLVWEIKASEFSGGILSLDMMQKDESTCLMVVGTMSGELIVFKSSSDGGSGETGGPQRLASSKPLGSHKTPKPLGSHKTPGEPQRLASTKPHSKFLIRCLFATLPELPTTPLLLSTGHDQSVCISKLSDQGIDLIRRIPFLTTVNDITFLSQHNSLIVALKDSPCLRSIDLVALLNREPGQEDEATVMSKCEMKISLNENGDTHVSSSVKFLSISPDGRFLGAATDSSRVLVLRIGQSGHDWRLRSLFISQTSKEQFHTPSLAWHYCSNYLYVSSGVGGAVEVIHLGSGRSCGQISAHKVNVRDLIYDLKRKALLTCSFDKTVKIWG